MQPELKISASLRRVSTTEWVAMDDAGHAPLGILSIVVEPTRLRVNHDFVASKVSSLQVTPDDGFASSSVRVGASVGLSYTNLYFYMPDSSTPVNPGLLSKAGANVWITGWFYMPEEINP